MSSALRGKATTEAQGAAARGEHDEGRPAITTTTSTAAVHELANAVLDLGGLALAFGRIDRTAVYHPDGVTPESDSDHTVMLGWVACAFAARCFPQLNLGLVAQLALVHDAVEVHAGDTPTLRIDANGRAAKAAREHDALLRLADEFDARLPWFPEAIAVYEAQQVPEARFVRALDKLMPKVVHLLDGAAGLVEHGMRRTELIAVFTRQRTDMARYAGEFTALLALHAELVARVVEQPALADDPPACDVADWRRVAATAATQPGPAPQQESEVRS